MDSTNGPAYIIFSPSQHNLIRLIDELRSTRADQSHAEFARDIRARARNLVHMADAEERKYGQDWIKDRPKHTAAIKLVAHAVHDVINTKTSREENSAAALECIKAALTLLDDSSEAVARALVD